MNGTLEDLTSLRPKRLARRLTELARDALPCRAANVFDGNPQHGLTVGLWVETHGRPDVEDLPRVLETEPGGHVTTGWSLLHPDRRHPHPRLLLHVHLQRPVTCGFVVRCDIRDQPADPMHSALPLLLAADGFALGLNGYPHEHPGVWIPAPQARDCIYEVITAGTPTPRNPRRSRRTLGLRRGASRR